VLPYKFLSPGATGRFSGFRWPAPGEWVEPPGPVALCGSGVHACRLADLPLWIDEELWRIELGGDILETESVVVAERGRLVELVEAWCPEAMLEFVRACAARAQEHAGAAGTERTAGYAADAQYYAGQPLSAANAAVTSYVAAHTAEAARADGLAAERAWQAGWLAQRLELS